MKQKKFMILALLTMLIYAVYIFFLAPIVSERVAVRNIEFEDIDLTLVADGDYLGVFEAGGYPYEVEVSVTGHRIMKINVINNRSGEHAQKAEEVTERIIADQSLQVDAISGATTTSKALIKAVENALRAAVEQY